MGIYLQQNGTPQQIGGGINQAVLDRILTLETGIQDTKNRLQQSEAELQAIKSSLQNSNIELSALKNSKATASAYGLSKISGSTTVTEDAGLVLSAKEKNPAVNGTLANEINKVANEMFKEHEPPTDANTIRGSGIYAIYNATINAPVGYGVLLMFDADSYAMQIIKSAVVSAPQLFIRTRDGRSNNNWGNWVSYNPT